MNDIANCLRFNIIKISKIIFFQITSSNCYLNRKAISLVRWATLQNSKTVRVKCLLRLVRYVY